MPIADLNTLLNTPLALVGALHPDGSSPRSAAVNMVRMFGGLSPANFASYLLNEGHIDNSVREQGQSLMQMALSRKAAKAAGGRGRGQSIPLGPGGPVIHGVNPADPADLRAVQLAKSFIGTPYVWGGARPGGFDCSGLIQYVWAKNGVNIPRVTYDQFNAGKAVSPKALRPGDAVFFRGGDPLVRNGRVLPGHVGLYIGNGKFIEAPHTGSTVHISSLSGYPGYMGARRYR